MFGIQINVGDRDARLDSEFKYLEVLVGGPRGLPKRARLESERDLKG